MNGCMVAGVRRLERVRTKADTWQMVGPCISTRREPTRVSKALVTRGKEVGAKERLFHYRPDNLLSLEVFFPAITPGRL